MRKLNDYRAENDYIVGTTSKGEVFLFDIDKYEIVNQYTWYINKQGYVVTWIQSNGNRTVIRMHNLITGLLYIDHINRNKQDNRSINLRPIDKQHNALNSAIQKNNTSGIRGVHKSKHTGKYQSYLKIKGIKIYLGSFDYFDDAVKARLNGELRYFGYDFSPQKHLFERYL